MEKFINLFIVYTGDKFNRILMFKTYGQAAAWLRSTTNYSEIEIARAIKTPKDNGNGYLEVFDK